MIKNKKLLIALGSSLIVLLIVAGIFLYLHDQKETVAKAEAKAAVEARLATWRSGGGEAFAEQYILGGVDVSEEMRATYTEVCTEMLCLMKYEVSEVTQLEEGEYSVTVQYQSADIYQRFLEAIESHAEQFLKDAKKEEYSVKKEKKIAAQIQENYLAEVCQLLKDACKSPSYSDAETMDFEVTVNENGEFVIDESQISQFVVKILHIDEIQD